MSPEPENPLITFEEAELRVLRAGQALSFREKLKWLEDAQELARRLQTARIRRPDPDHPGQWIITERQPNTQ